MRKKYVRDYAMRTNKYDAHKVMCITRITQYVLCI